MLFKGKSSKLELLIEKIQANKENGADSETGSVANEGKWATTCSLLPRRGPLPVILSRQTDKLNRSDSSKLKVQVCIANTLIMRVIFALGGFCSG